MDSAPHASVPGRLVDQIEHYFLVRLTALRPRVANDASEAIVESGKAAGSGFDIMTILPINYCNVLRADGMNHGDDPSASLRTACLCGHAERALSS